MCLSIEIRKRHLIRNRRLLPLLGEIHKLELEGRLAVGRHLRHELHRRSIRGGPQLLDLRHHQEDQQQMEQQRYLESSPEGTFFLSHVSTLASFLPLVFHNEVLRSQIALCFLSFWASTGRLAASRLPRSMPHWQIVHGHKEEFRAKEFLQKAKKYNSNLIGVLTSATKSGMDGSDSLVVVTVRDK